MAPIIKAITVVVYSLTLLQLALCRPAPKQELCGDKNVKLHSIDDLLHTSADGCTDHVREAYHELVRLVEEPNVCTMDKATGITRYYENYLRGPSDGQSVDAAPSMQMQSLATRELEESDLEAVKEWTRDDSPVARLLGSIAKQGEFLVPADFSALAPEVMRELKLKLTTDNDKLLRVREVCEKRFRPLYEPVVLPIAQLSRNGVNYVHAYMATTRNFYQGYRNKFALWSRIVFLCESMKEVEVIETSAGSATKRLNLVTDESDEQEAKVEDKTTSSSLKQLERFDMFALINGGTRHEQRHLEAATKYRLYSAADFKMKSSIRSFNATLSETERFRDKLLGSKWSLLFATFKSDENTRKLFKRALQMVMAASRESNQQEELKSAEKQLVGLVDSKKNSTFFKVLSKIAKGGMILLRSFSWLLLTALLILSVAYPNAVSGIGELVTTGRVTDIPLTYTFGIQIK